MKHFWENLRMFIWMTLLTGIVYPLVVMGIAYMTMRHKAEGSLVTANGKIIGSGLIAQKFAGEKYFWPRPSFVDYNPLPSGGSNLGPTSAELKKKVDERRSLLTKAFGVKDPANLPNELLFASGSGLDPHIRPETAFFQAERIAKARNIDPNDVIELIYVYTQTPFLGFIGTTCVNVLLLNQGLDKINPAASHE